MRVCCRKIWCTLQTHVEGRSAPLTEKEQVIKEVESHRQERAKLVCDLEPGRLPLHWGQTLGCPHWARGGPWKGAVREQEPRTTQRPRGEPRKVLVSPGQAVALSLRFPSRPDRAGQQQRRPPAPSENVGGAKAAKWGRSRVGPAPTIVSRERAVNGAARANQDAACK